MDHSNGLVWKRPSSGPDSDDVWDDRALIDAYDKAVKEVNRRLADKSNESNDKTVNNNDQTWHLGQYCRCAYSEDGIEYEAQIISINVLNNTCFVKYIGYENEEQKSLKELKTSLGKKYRKLQTLQTQQSDTQEMVNSGSDNDIDNSSTVKKTLSESKQKQIRSDSQNWFMPSTSNLQAMVPPPLPSALESCLPSDDESLASMLMSWYMSGYHTGYYRALKQCRHLCNK